MHDRGAIAARSIEGRRPTPRDDDGRASLARCTALITSVDVHSCERSPSMATTKSPGKRPRRSPKSPQTHRAHRLGRCIPRRTRHAWIILRRRYVDIGRIAISGIVAREGVVRGLQERIQNRRRAGIGIVGIETLDFAKMPSTSFRREATSPESAEAAWTAAFVSGSSIPKRLIRSWFPRTTKPAQKSATAHMHKARVAL